MVRKALRHARTDIAFSTRIKKLKLYTPAALLAILLSVGAVTLAAQNDKPELHQESQEQSGGQLVPVDSNGNEALDTTEGAQIRTRIESKSSTTSSGESSVDLKVNGQTVPIPENGTHEQTITSNDSETDVHVDVQNNSETEDDSDTKIRIDSDFDSDIDIRTRTRSP